MAQIKVYLDNCTYNRPFDDQSQIRISLESQAKLYIQRLIINKELNLVYSYMSLFENSENPNPEHRNSIRDFFRYATEFIDIDKADIIGRWILFRRLQMRNTAAILNDGMDCLLEKLGVLETEIFISHILRESFDYTAWQKEHYANISVQELNRRAAEYGKAVNAAR